MVLRREEAIKLHKKIVETHDGFYAGLNLSEEDLKFTRLELVKLPLIFHKL